MVTVISTVDFTHHLLGACEYFGLIIYLTCLHCPTSILFCITDFYENLDLFLITILLAFCDAVCAIVDCMFLGCPAGRLFLCFIDLVNFSQLSSISVIILGM